MEKKIYRQITATIVVHSRSEKSTAEAISKIQGLLDDMAFDENCTANISFDLTKEIL